MENIEHFFNSENGYNRHNARSPVPARKNLLFAGDSCLDRFLKMEYFLNPIL
jgi:hypothetical protein